MGPKYFYSLGAVLAIGLGSCAAPDTQAVRPKLRPLGKDLATYQPPLQPAVAVPAGQQIEKPTGALTLRKALSLALLQNPELAAFAWEVRSGEARTLQAGLFPNPEIDVEGK